jgi:hypothetical protein
MNKNRKLLLLSFSILSILILGACGLSPEEQAELETQVAMEITQTHRAMSTDTPIPTATFTATPIPTSTPNMTATVKVLETAQAQPMADLIQNLYSEGNLSRIDGVYYNLPDYEATLAKLNWMEPISTGLFLNDFVLRGNLAWETAKKGANITGSGCGFTFGIDEDFKNYHITIFALDGNVRLFRCLNCGGRLNRISSGYFGKIDYMEGDVDFILIMDGKRIQFFVNGEHSFDLPNQKDFDGYLAYTISSGSNYDFGTRCSWTNMELWEITD